MTEKKLSKASSSYSYVTNPSSLIGGYVPGTITYNSQFEGSSTLPYSNNILSPPCNYQQELYQCRFFYKRDPFAATVINRMAEMTARRLSNKRNFCTDEEYNYFAGLSCKIDQLIQTMALEYFIAGMVVPDYLTTRVMGNRIHPELGRKRYIVPDPLWVRNTDNIRLKRVPLSCERAVFLRIPPEERDFIVNNGKRSDGTEDTELYLQLVKQFPEYVAMVKEGRTEIYLPDVKPVLRKALPHSDYPQPFLVPSLDSLKHKMRIKEMDYTFATRAIQAIRHVKIGNDEYPVTEDDDSLTALKEQLQAQSPDAAMELILTLYTNHTVEFEWVYPQLDVLLSADKYLAVDADIFMGMGFSRVLLTGETLRSNSSNADTAIVGPQATLIEARENIIYWLRWLYRNLADLNGFTNIPEPVFEPLAANDVSTLIQYASNALKDKIISRNTYAMLFGTTFDSELVQISAENEQLSEVTPDPTAAPAPNSPQHVDMIKQGIVPDPNENTNKPGTT
jgi:hypothetical protein